MLDFRTVRNNEIIRAVRKKLYNIICDHVKHFDDENAMKHIEMFMEGVFWACGLRYAVRRDGKVYVYLKCLSFVEKQMVVIEYEYEVIDIFIEIKILRNAINRHYHKMGGKF